MYGYTDIFPLYSTGLCPLRFSPGPLPKKRKRGIMKEADKRTAIEEVKRKMRERERESFKEIGMKLVDGGIGFHEDWSTFEAVSLPRT